MQSIGSMPGDAAADIFKIGARIDVEGPAGLHKRELSCCGLATFCASKKEPIFPPDGQRADCPFGWIVVQTSRYMLSEGEIDGQI